MTTKKKDSVTQYGAKLEKLGLALQNPRSKLTTLSKLAFDCGIQLQLRFVSNKGELEPVTLNEEQWKRFLSVAFRHCTIEGDIHFTELQQGLDAALRGENA